MAKKPSKQRQGGGRVVAFPKRKKERWRRGGFVPLDGGGTPIFELDDEQCSEFFISDQAVAHILIQKLLLRRAWLMVHPPHDDSKSWGILVQLSEVDFVEDYLKRAGELYLCRGLQNPE